MSWTSTLRSFSSQVLVELNLFLIGWITYCRYAACRFELQWLDEWIRRKLRCHRLKRRKRGASIAALLRSLGVSAASARGSYPSPNMTRYNIKETAVYGKYIR